MTEHTHLASRGVAIAALLLASACATSPRFRSAALESQGITEVLESDDSIGVPAASDDPARAKLNEPAVPLAYRRMASGRPWAGDPFSRAGWWGGASCGTRPFALWRGRLVDEDALYMLNPFVAAQSSAPFALAFTADPLGGIPLDRSCGSSWSASDALAERARDLAPEISRRDTSVLFSTAREGMVRSGGTSVARGVAPERATTGSRDARATPPPRTARPRGAARGAP